MQFDDGISYGPYEEAERKARLAYKLYEDGKTALALMEIESAIQINPANAAWHFNKGLLLDGMGKFDEAIAEYETAIEISPQDTEILNCLAVDYTRAGQYDRAIKVFEYIQSIDPDFEPSYCNRIITYTEMGLHDKAEEMFYTAQHIDQDCPLCFYNIGNSLFVRSEYKKAANCWLKTAELEPTHPRINYRIAQASWADGDKVTAQKYFLQELRENPGDVEVIIDFGLLLLEAGKIEQAAEKFNRALEMDPQCAQAMFYLGEISLNNNQPEKAELFYKKAIAQDEQILGPSYRLAQRAMFQANKRQAKSYLLAELKACPEDAAILVSMASMFLELEDYESAINCLLQAVDIDDSNAQANYYLGLVSALKQRYENAEEFFNHTLELQPDHIETLRDLAVILVETGRIPQAVQTINRAASLASDDPQVKTIARQIRFLNVVKTLTRILPEKIAKKLL